MSIVFISAFWTLILSLLTVQVVKCARDIQEDDSEYHLDSETSGDAWSEKDPNFILYERLLPFLAEYLNDSNMNNFNDSEYLCQTVVREIYGIHVEIEPGKIYCNSSWDDVSCWPTTLSGTNATVPCPGYLEGIEGTANATKYCHSNGTWASKADYRACVTHTDDDHLPPLEMEEEYAISIRVIYHVGFCLSSLTLAIALFIFLYFRSLRCLRNMIHCHLIVTFILQNAFWIIMRHSLLPIANSPYLWICKAEVTLFSYSQATGFFWMFVEGLYLHIIIVWTYSADKIRLWYFAIMGWGLPAGFVLAWALAKHKFQNTTCWMPMQNDEVMYDFIFIGPILIVLLANVIFLSTIIWVLITKLRASHSWETKQYRKAVKATIILFPLLGITYVLFIIPPSDDRSVYIVFKFINAVLQSFQGFFVAVFYCFLNGEVKGVLKKKISRFNDARSLSTKYTKTSVGWIRGSRDYGQTLTMTNGSPMNSIKKAGSSSPWATRRSNEEEEEEAEEMLQS